MLSRVGAYIRRGESLRPGALAAAAVRVAARGGRRWVDRRRDLSHPTYAPEAPRGGLVACLGACERTERVTPELLAACAHYRAHEFDVLGSGWTSARYGAACAGFAGVRFPDALAVVADDRGSWLAGRVTPANLDEACRVWSLVDPGYEPIDWQLDLRSGFRWSAIQWYADVRYGRVRGADVKVPWELGRSHHLPQLALAYGATGDERWAREVRNQILDFVAANPPRFGVQWCSTMDVAIRVANWVVAADLLDAAGYALDEDARRVLARSVLEHARHVAANLEWFPTHRGNHYLADVVGLLAAAVHLPRSPDVDAWTALAVQEIVAEAEYQFGDDGTNFEASTCYHRLSAEMLLYGAAMIQGLSPERRAALRTYDASRLSGPPTLHPAGAGVAALPAWLLARVEAAGEFTWRITKPTGAVAQIGDNDSGRFLKLQPALHATGEQCARSFASSTELVEDALDHRHLVAAVGTMFGRDDLVVAGAPYDVDGRVLAALAGGRRWPGRGSGSGAAADRARVGTPAERDALLQRIRREAIDTVSQTLRFDGAPLTDGVVASAYPDFGLFVWRSRRLFLAVRCGPVGQAGYGGHAHNDQLALELSVDGCDRLRDPGTFVYTALPERRNAYRSVAAHAAPRLAGVEPSRLDAGLFLLRDDPRATCLYFGTDGFLGRHDGYGAPLHRHVAFVDDGLVVTDFLAPGGVGERLDREARLDQPQGAVPFSPAYGVACP